MFCALTPAILRSAIRLRRRIRRPHPHLSRRNNYISTGRHVKRASVTFWIGIHEIDVVQWVTGLKVESVFARGVKKRLADLNMHDTIFTSAQFEKGTIGVFENSYALPQVQGERWSPSLYVTGTEGLLHLTPYQTGLRINKAENIGTIDPLYDMKGNVYGRLTGVYQEETEHFLECVREGKRPLSPAGRLCTLSRWPKRLTNPWCWAGRSRLQRLSMVRTASPV